MAVLLDRGLAAVRLGASACGRHAPGGLAGGRGRRRLAGAAGHPVQRRVAAQAVSGAGQRGDAGRVRDCAHLVDTGEFLSDGPKRSHACPNLLFIISHQEKR